jgi:hypothetical protein
MESLDWLQATATTGVVQIHHVLEETTPAGHMGRLVELKVGSLTTQCREIVAGFAEGHFDSAAFWQAPLANVPQDYVPEVEHDDHDDGDLPCVGFARLPPHHRPSFEGSKRQAIAQRVARAANNVAEPADAALDGSDVDTDYEEQQQEGGRKAKKAQKKPVNGRATTLVETFETREVRAIIGLAAAGADTAPELWFYCPLSTADGSNTVRKG